MSPVFAIVALWVLAGSPSRAAEPVTLENDKLRLVFDAQGRLMELGDAAGRGRAPMDRAALTEPWVIELRSAAGEVSRVTPQTPPRIERRGDALHCAWSVAVAGGKLAVRARR